MDTVKRQTKPELNVLLIQISVVTALIIMLTVVKFLGGDLYTELVSWYIINFSGDTKISEVLEEPQGSADENEISGEQALNTAALLPDIPAGDTNIILTAVPTSPILQITTAFQSTTLLMPVNNATVSSHFGERSNPITHNAETHKGVDLAAPKGSDIFAAEGGTVILSQKSASYGNYIIIDHGNGMQTLYAHCSKLLKRVGDTVEKGDIIARVGSTGQSTGPHLHFEVIKNGEYLNPLTLVEK